MIDAECPGAFLQSRHVLDIHSLRLKKHTKIDVTQTVLRQLSRTSHTYSHPCPFLPSSRPCHLSQAISDRDDGQRIHNLNLHMAYGWKGGIAPCEHRRELFIHQNARRTHIHGSKCVLRSHVSL